MDELSQGGIPRGKIGIRLIFTLLFLVILSVMHFIIQMTALIQYVVLLITRSYSEPLRSFSNKAAVYVYRAHTIHHPERQRPPVSVHRVPTGDGTPGRAGQVRLGGVIAQFSFRLSLFPAQRLDLQVFEHFRPFCHSRPVFPPAPGDQHFAVFFTANRKAYVPPFRREKPSKPVRPFDYRHSVPEKRLLPGQRLKFVGA